MNTPKRRRDQLLEAARAARDRGDRIRASVLERDARIVCYLWDLPLPAGGMA